MDRFSVAEMEAYDRLPYEVRKAIRDSKTGPSAMEVYEYWVNNGTIATLIALANHDEIVAQTNPQCQGAS